MKLLVRGSIGDLECSLNDRQRKAYREFALPGAKQHYARDKTFHVNHFKLDLVPDFQEKKIWGRCTTYLTAIDNGLTYVDFDAVELAVKSVKDEGGTSLKFETFDGKLRVHFASKANLGERVTTAIEYETKPRWGMFFSSPDEYDPKRPIEVWTQGEEEYSRYWFPCYDFPNEKSTSEITVTVPENFTVVSNGKLVEAVKKNNLIVFHWLQEVPYSTYLTSVVAGEFTEMKDVYEGIPILYYVPKGREGDANRSFSETPEMVKFISEYTGVKYPYAKYSQVTVSDFIFGGMENVSATTLTDQILHDERAHLDYSNNDLVVHELAHQWFGDLLTCRDWSHAWLNEGFATFFEVLYKEHSLGIDEAQYHVMRDIELYIEEDKERYRRPIVSKTYIDPNEVFDRHLYEKGALVLNYIRYLLGEERFRRAIRHYTSKFKQQNVETDDFRRAIEEATGRNLEPYFEQWFYKGGYPELSVKYEWVESQKSVKLTITQNQAVEAETPVFNFAVDVAVVLRDGKRRVEKVKVEEKEATLFLPAEERPASVIFDPGNWLPKTIKLERPVEDSLFDLREGTQATERIMAARHLATVASDKATRALEESLLTDKFWGVGAEAARALGKIGTNHAKKALLTALQKVEHPKARRAIVAALGEFRGDDIGSALQKTLDNDVSYFVEGEAARSLGKSGHSEAFEVLQRALSKDSFSDEIRAGAFDGFGELKDNRAIELAFEWTGPGHSYRARRAAALCLGKLGKGKHEVVRHLFRLLKDPEFRVRVSVCGALAEIADPMSIPELEKVEGADLDARVRRAAREAIRNIRDSLETTQELKLMHEELDQLKRENRDLKERLERLETHVQGS